MTVKELIAENNRFVNLYKLPCNCEFCGSDLLCNTNLTRIYCGNNKCSQKVVAKVDAFLRKLDIKGLGPALISTFVENSKIEGIASFIKQKDELINLGANGQKVLTQLNSKLKEPIVFHNFLSVFNLSDGETGFNEGKLSKLKDLNINNIDSIKSMTSSIAEIAGFTLKSAELLADLIEIELPDIKEAAAYFKFATETIGNTSFCFTGKLSQPRSYFEKLAISKGCSIKPVNKELTYLVAEDPESNSGKMVKAKSLGIKVISEADFMAIIGEM